MNEYLPDMSEIPDSEAKRKAEDLAFKFNLLLEQLGTEEMDDIQHRKLHNEANEIWYKMNSQVGRVFELERNKKSDNDKYYISLLFSLAALVVSAISFFK